METKISYLKFLKQTTKGKHSKGLFKCVCGTEKEIALNHVRVLHTISCGCKSSRLTAGARSRTHGMTGKHPLYGIWNTMKARCYEPNSQKYKNYGAVGVRVCEEWIHDFKCFYDWCLKNGWKKGMQIDKDIKGNGLLYSPENCLLVTSKINNNHRTNNRIIEYNGKKQTLAQWSEDAGIKAGTIWSRIAKSKWNIKDALTTKPEYATNTTVYKEFLANLKRI